MRKQSLVITLLVMVLCTMATATSRLTDVRVQTQGDVGVVAIQANGAFTHTEYRPTDNLLLVDLAGVTANPDGKTHDVKIPGVSSYRVIGYKGSFGVDTARVELALVTGAVVNVSEAGGAVVVKVSLPKGGAPEMQGATKHAAEPIATTAMAAAPKPGMATAPAMAAKAPKVGGMPVTVKHVGVVRSHDGMAIEIMASGPISATAMKLTQPDRLVVDVANSRPMGRQHDIAVNSGNVKMVRTGHYQLNPPTTRVVVDLLRAQDYDLVTTGNKATLKLRAQAAPEVAHMMPVSASAQPQTTMAQIKPAMLTETPKPTASTPTSAMPAPLAADSKPKDFVVVEPTYTSKPAANATTQAPAMEPAAARAAEAASRFRKPQESVTAPVSASLQPNVAINLALMQQQQTAAQAGVVPEVTSCDTGRYSGEPISVNLKDVDLKDFFRLIHEISGFNVVLDPNVKGSLTIVLDDVPWDQALSIVLKNNTLECQLEGNVLRVATVDTIRKEADMRRGQQEAQALAVAKTQFTHYLSYAHAKDVAATVKKFLSSRGDVIADDRTNALIIEDIPSVLPAVKRLLLELDRKTQEVEIEARVVAATRNFARDIGTQFGFGFGGATTAVGGVTGNISPIKVTSVNPPFFIQNSGQIPLFSNFPAVGATSGLSFVTGTDRYRLDAVLTMAESRGLLKILSRPRVVTQNNIRALVKQGVKIPIVTAAQLGGPPTTTYIDASLRLTVTPQITAEGTIFLDVDVENTTPDFGNQVNGQPTLITQQTTTQVLVTDGGTVVIGGVIQTQNSVSITQVPVLGNIPILGNLFKRRAVSTSTQELIFFITPKIVQT